MKTAPRDHRVPWGSFVLIWMPSITKVKALCYWHAKVVEGCLWLAILRHVGVGNEFAGRD